METPGAFTLTNEGDLKYTKVSNGQEETNWSLGTAKSDRQAWVDDGSPEYVARGCDKVCSVALWSKESFDYTGTRWTTSKLREWVNVDPVAVGISVHGPCSVKVGLQAAKRIYMSFVEQTFSACLCRWSTAFS